MLFEQRATILLCICLRCWSCLIRLSVSVCTKKLKYSKWTPSTQHRGELSKAKIHAYTQSTHQAARIWLRCLLWLCFYRSVSCQRCCSCGSLSLSLVLPFSSFFCPLLSPVLSSRFSSICLLFCSNSVQFFHFAYYIFTIFFFIYLFICLLICSLLFAFSSTIDFVLAHTARTNSH